MLAEPLAKPVSPADVREIHLASGSLSVRVLSYGALIRSLSFDAGQGPQERVLGFADLRTYLDLPVYFGVVAGRYANRIAGGRFSLDGVTHRLDVNEGRRNHLHGGGSGFSRRNWQVIDESATHVTLELVSPAGDQGYPGRLVTRCTYRITGDGVLQIRLEATTDAPTIVNLATHSYFNLDGSSDVRDHQLMIPAETYLPVDAHLIPTGVLAPVAGTPFDFREPRAVRGPVVYDHNFVIDRARVTSPRLMARLEAAAIRTRLEIHSTEPGVQLYDGAGIRQTLPAQPYAAYAGLCLEPQMFPDAPNQPDFPDASLRPGGRYEQITEYRFSAL